MRTDADRALAPVVLFGPMGSGKSSIAPLVARELGRTMIDLDAAVEARAGATIPRIFAESGEARFRELEREVLLATLERADGPIVAAGGGALADGSLRDAVLDRACVVTLTAPLATLIERVGPPAARPLLAGRDPRAALEEILANRREAYADGTFSVDTSVGAPIDVARQVARLAGEGRHALVSQSDGRRWVHVTHAPWEVLSNVVQRAQPTNVVLVTDSNVAAHYLSDAAQALGALLGGDAIVLPPGEPTKRLEVLGTILEGFAVRGADRRSLIVSLGGGVVSDLTGFAAAVYMRGIRWVAVATSTVAMVDAAIGGKTAVDLGARKNSVGAFHLPLATIVSPGFARTESARAIRSGLSEAIKTFAVADERTFARLEGFSDESLLGEEALSIAIEESALRKASIVREDPLDRGRRAILNFGHSFGHSLESAGGFERWTHGEAVALGMVAALRVGRQVGVTDPTLAERIESLLRRAGLPTSLDRASLERASALLAADKKRAGDVLHFILLEALGKPRILPISLQDLERMAPSLASA